MRYRIDSSEFDEIVLGETDTVRSVIQNIKMILNTAKGTVPLDRNFGINKDAMHRPINVAKVMLYSEIREAIETYEPRATVTGVDYYVNAEAPDVLIPIVEVEISE